MAKGKWYEVMNFNVCLHWNQLENFSLLQRQPNDLSLSLAFKTNDDKLIVGQLWQSTNISISSKTVFKISDLSGSYLSARRTISSICDHFETRPFLCNGNIFGVKQSDLGNLNDCLTFS